MLSNPVLAKTMVINADLGEGCSHDADLFKLVDWANIACGGHTGDEQSIQRACTLALEHNVQVGAHPSYPDKAGFGRLKPEEDPGQLLDELKRQMDLFENIAAKMGCTTSHFKPHGQLYNDAAFDQETAALLIELAKAYPHLRLLALAESPQVALTRAQGIAVIEEAFPDRAYQANGALVPRSQKGAVLDDPKKVKSQAAAMMRLGPIECIDGSSLVIRAQTLCVHGDTPQALANAQVVRQAVQEHDRDAFSGAD